MAIDRRGSGRDMVTLSSALRSGAFGLMMLLALLGAAYVNGAVLLEPGGPIGVLLALSWCAMTAVLCSYALTGRRAAVDVLTVLTVLAAAVALIEGLLRAGPRDQIGLAGTMCSLGVAVGAGFLGLRRAARAGWLLLALGLAVGGAGDPGLAMAAPIVMASILFLTSDALGRRRPGPLPGAR